MVALAPVRSSATSEPQPRVYFVSGFASIFDDLTALATLFAIDGVPALTYPPAFWRAVVFDAEAAYAANAGNVRIVIVGHSMGAVHAYDAAAALGRSGIPVALVVGFDPIREAEVSGNVSRAVNYFLTPEVTPVVPAPAFAGVLVNEIVGDEATLAHGDIIFDEALRLRAIAEIRQALD